MAMSERTSKVLKIVGYVAFFLVALLLFVRLTLPTGQLKEFLKIKIAEQLSAESVAIEDLSFNGLFPSGATIEGFELTLPPIKVKTPDRGVDVMSASRVLVVEELSFDGSLLGALGGDYDFTFEGMVQGGEIGGRVSMKPGAGAKLAIENMNNVAIGSESLFLSLIGMDIIGNLSGKVDVAIPSVDRDGRSALAFEQMAATVDIKLDEAKMLGPVIDTVMNREPVRLGFTDVALGTITLKAQSEGQPTTGTDPKSATSPKRGVLNIEEASVLGGDVEVMSAPKGNIAIPPGGSLKDGTIALHLAVKIADAWFDKTEKDRKDPTKTTKPNSGLRTMLTLGPLKQHVVDGQFGVSITGPLSSPQVQTTRPRTRVATTPGAGGGRKLNVDQPDTDTEEEDNAPAKPSRASRAMPAREPERPASPVVRQAVSRPIDAAPANRPRPNIAVGGPDEPMPEPVMPTPTRPPEPVQPSPEFVPLPEEPMVDPGAPSEEHPGIE